MPPCLWRRSRDLNADGSPRCSFGPRQSVAGGGPWAHMNAAAISGLTSHLRSGRHREIKKEKGLLRQTGDEDADALASPGAGDDPAEVRDRKRHLRDAVAPDAAAVTGTTAILRASARQAARRAPLLMASATFAQKRKTIPRKTMQVSKIETAPSSKPEPLLSWMCFMAWYPFYFDAPFQRIEHTRTGRSWGKRILCDAGPAAGLCSTLPGKVAGRSGKGYPFGRVESSLSPGGRQVGQLPQTHKGSAHRCANPLI